MKGQDFRKFVILSLHVRNFRKSYPMSTTPTPLPLFLQRMRTPLREVTIRLTSNSQNC